MELFVGEITSSPGPKGPLDERFLARFWSKVDRVNGPVHPVVGRCWPWMGGRTRYGYGRVAVRGPKKWEMRAAHREALGIALGSPVAPEAIVRHHCDFPPCCRPEHLTAGTQAENLADMRAKGRDVSGEKHGWSVLTEAAVAEIRRRRAGGELIVDLASAFGVTWGNVHQICKGATWRKQPMPAALTDGTELPRGDRKLNAIDVKEIREKRAAGRSLREIGAEYGVCEAAVCVICKGQSWQSAEGPLTGTTPENAIVFKPDRSGERAPSAVLTDAKVIEIRRRASAGERGMDLAAEFGVSRASVSLIGSGKTWRHLLPAADRSAVSQ